MLNRYAAKLFFQYRVDTEVADATRRICEEKIVVVYALNAEQAFEKALLRGAREEKVFLNDDANTVYFEFIGVMELLGLEAEASQDEVWSELKDYVMPKENKQMFLPDKRELSAMRMEAYHKGNVRWRKLN